MGERFAVGDRVRWTGRLGGRRQGRALTRLP